MDLHGKKTLVLGAGRSGIAASRFLSERGAVVALHDKLPIDRWNQEARSLKMTHNVGLMDGDIPSWLLDQIELVVISPGVPTSSIPARYVDRKDGEVIGEIELAYRFLKGRVVGITGSNGKTTTTALVGRILEDAGIETQVGGNIGTPLLSLTQASSDNGWTVVELSSYQLETTKTFRANVAVCLNVTPNHLDRYPSFQDYAGAKHRLFLNQTAEDVAILNADDEITNSWQSGLRANIVMFSVSKELREGLFMRGDSLVSRMNGKETILMPRSEILLKGGHNVENVLAALAVGLACGASSESMRETVRSFRGVEHRLEFVDQINGISFYNDSKATSVDATAKALDALRTDDAKIVLIMGGQGKNAPYDPLFEPIRAYVRQVIAIGEDAPNIQAQLKGSAEILNVLTMTEAVETAYGTARLGDTVLLAPACASFDMFTNFEARGESFKHAVYGLASKFEEAKAS